MAIYRVVHTGFWRDEKVIEEMTPEDKLYFLYLLTNPSTTQIGIYKITKKEMAFELGYSMESINALMDRFEKHHRLIRYNNKTREIAIKNWAKHNLKNAGKPMIDCVKKELEGVKDVELIDYVAETITIGNMKNVFEIYANKGLESLSDSSYNLENDVAWTGRGTERGQKEKEKEKENKKEKEKENKKEKEEHGTRYVGRYKKLYEQNIGLINGVAYEWICELSEEIDVDLFKKAIEIATDRGKCGKGYINGIIRQWLSLNIKSLTDLEAYEVGKNKGGETDDREYREDKVYQRPTKEQLEEAKKWIN